MTGTPECRAVHTEDTYYPTEWINDIFHIFTVSEGLALFALRQRSWEAIENNLLVQTIKYQVLFLTDYRAPIFPLKAWFYVMSLVTPSLSPQAESFCSQGISFV